MHLRQADRLFKLKESSTKERLLIIKTEVIEVSQLLKTIRWTIHEFR
jgi:hypothetical protein|tara:strand:- start:101 stop:241 length:141 start_codon:yes stop_codon:yes gene_type:complete